MNEAQGKAAAIGRLIELTILLNEDLTRGLERDGLTPARTGLIWELRKRGSPMTQRELAEALGVSARNITGLVDGLVATGFVTREPHPTDRRATLVSFTEHGAGVVARMEREQDEFAALLFDDMAPQQFDSFMAGLDVVLDRIREELARIQKEEK